MKITQERERMEWDGRRGHAWVEAQTILDGMFKPFEDMLAEAVAASSGSRVLDVGCGTGSTTLAAARAAGGVGRAVGVDISEPMIAAARVRAERERLSASFVCADAESYAFDPRSFDTIISRFGVMFFGDSVRAFANLRRAATDGAALRLIAWRGVADNPFMTTAERAAAPLLPNMPVRSGDPADAADAPGQFAFARSERVRRILEESGWRDIEIRPIDVACAFPKQELTFYISRLGPLGLALQDADDEMRARVIEVARRAFDPYVQGGDVRFNAACWMIGARAG